MLQCQGAIQKLFILSQMVSNFCIKSEKMVSKELEIIYPMKLYWVHKLNRKNYGHTLHPDIWVRNLGITPGCFLSFLQKLLRKSWPLYFQNKYQFHPLPPSLVSSPELRAQESQDCKSSLTVLPAFAHSLIWICTPNFSDFCPRTNPLVVQE